LSVAERNEESQTTSAWSQLLSLLPRDGKDTAWKRAWWVSAGRGPRDSHEGRPPVGARSCFAEDTTEPAPRKPANPTARKANQDGSFCVSKCSSFAYLPHLHIKLRLICICKYMPVSVQISLVPLPLKSVCVVGAWAGVGRARGALRACGPRSFVAGVRGRGARSHEFIFVHAFLIKRKSECLWFNSWCQH